MSYSVQLQQRTACIKPENARTLSTGSIPGEDFSNIMGRIIPVLGYKTAMLCVLTEQRESLMLKHACGIRETSLAFGAGPLSRSDVDNRVLRGEVVTMAEARSEDSLPYSQIALGEGLQSMLAIPYKIGGWYRFLAFS